MKEVWIVNMGVGENVRQREAMRVFGEKEDAIKYVEDCFRNQIKSLHNFQSPGGLHVGNSFYIYPMDIIEKENLEG